jgi:hypothetical protein
MNRFAPEGQLYADIVKIINRLNRYLGMKKYVEHEQSHVQYAQD